MDNASEREVAQSQRTSCSNRFRMERIPGLGGVQPTKTWAPGWLRSSCDWPATNSGCRSRGSRQSCRIILLVPGSWLEVKLWPTILQACHLVSFAPEAALSTKLNLQSGLGWYCFRGLFTYTYNICVGCAFRMASCSAPILCSYSLKTSFIDFYGDLVLGVGWAISCLAWTRTDSKSLTNLPCNPIKLEERNFSWRNEDLSRSCEFPDYGAVGTLASLKVIYHRQYSEWYSSYSRVRLQPRRGNDVDDASCHIFRVAWEFPSSQCHICVATGNEIGWCNGKIVRSYWL